MNKSIRKHKIISSIWLLAGITLMMWSAIELWQIATNSYLGVHSGAFKATLISLIFSCLCILGAIGIMKNMNWGRILLLLVSGITLLYGAAYLLMGGFEDTGPIYAIIVACICFLSGSSILLLHKKQPMKDNKQYLIAAIWFICGNLTSIAASFVFGNFSSHLIFPNNLLHINYRPAFVVYTSTNLIIVLLVAFLLSTAIGKKNIWTLTYVVGVVGLPLYSAIRSHINIFQHNLPVLDTLMPSLAVLMIITPLIAWAGATLGKKYGKKKTA